MKTQNVVLGLMLSVLVVSSVAGEVELPRYAGRVRSANIQAMIEPSGSFSVTYWGNDTAGQCPINPAWTITVTLVPGIDGVYIQSICPRTGPTPCVCDIFVRTEDTKRAWEAALEPYRQEYRRTLPIDPSPDARVRTDKLTYTSEARKGPVVGPFIVDLSSGKTVDVARGDEFNFTVDAFVPAGSESPCADPKGRPCRLTTQLWQVNPDGSREMLRWMFENGEAAKVWLQPGESVPVTMRGIFPHSKSFYPIPKGKAVLIGQWFLWKNYWSMADYKIPLGSFEVPLNIK